MKYGNYTINENNNTSVAKIVKAVKQNSNVIEFGSSYGYILKYLKDHKQCTVHGYEIDKEAVALANQQGIQTDYMDLDIIEKDFFENLDMNIDYIICADVLEHLKNMINVINFISLYLEKNRHCKLLVSFPNITYYGVTEQLLHGRFQYRDLGILDNTHLRFYDKFELEKIFNNNNLEIKSIECIDIDPKDSEFKVTLDTQVVNLLEAYNNDTYLTYQYVIEFKYSSTPIITMTQSAPKTSVLKSLNAEKDKLIIELSEKISRKDNQIIELNILAHKQQEDIKSLSLKNRVKSLLGLK